MLKEYYNNIAAYLMQYFDAYSLMLIIIITTLAAVGYFVLLSYIITQLDKGYFYRMTHPNSKPKPNQTSFIDNSLTLLIHVAKIFMGIILLVCGIIMLVLPGQGILTIIVGLSLLPFPGKQKLELYLLSRKSVKASLNWIRTKANKEPFTFE